MKYTNYKEISGKCNHYLNNTLRECLPKHSSVLVPFGPQAMLLWHQLRCWLPVPCCDKTSGPQATLRKKEFILVNGKEGARAWWWGGRSSGELRSHTSNHSEEAEQRWSTCKATLQVPQCPPHNYLETKHWDTCISGGHCSFKTLQHAVVSVSPVSWFYIAGIFT